MGSQNPSQLMVDNAILNNVQIIRNDFMLLHHRQKEMINKLENDFLSGLPDKIKNMPVSEFLQKYDGDINKAFNSLQTVDLNISQNNSTSSSFQSQMFKNNFTSKEKGFRLNNFADNMAQSKGKYQNMNNKLGNNSKRKRADFENSQKKLMSSIHQNLQSSHHKNKENYYQNTSNSQTQYQNNLNKSSAKKNNNNNNFFFPKSASKNPTASKTGKKHWK